MWFAQLIEVYAGGRIFSAAQVSLTCKGHETTETAIPGELNEPACGVRVKLLKMAEPGGSARSRSQIFRGTFEIAR